MFRFSEFSPKALLAAVALAGACDPDACDNALRWQANHLGNTALLVLDQPEFVERDAVSVPVLPNEPLDRFVTGGSHTVYCKAGVEDEDGSVSFQTPIMAADFLNIRIGGVEDAVRVSLACHKIDAAGPLIGWQLPSANGYEQLHTALDLKRWTTGEPFQYATFSNPYIKSVDGAFAEVCYKDISELPELGED